MRRVATTLAGIALVILWLRTLHLLLFREMLDRPVASAAWIAAAVLAAEAVRRRWRPVPRSAQFRAVVLPSTAAVLLLAFHLQYMGVASDGRDYFVQARSIAIERNLTITEDEVAAMGAPGQAIYYPIGTALLWTPALVGTHLLLGVAELAGAPAYPRTGYGGPYEVAAGLTSLLLGLAGMVLTTRLVSRIVAPGLALLATVVTVAGTFLLWYLVAEASMSHAASFFAVALFLYLWHGRGGVRTRGDWVRLGAAGGLMAIVRWQDVLFGLVLLPEVVGLAWHARRSAGRRRRLAIDLLAGLAAALVVGLPQLLLWRLNNAGWLAMPTDRFVMSWADPGLVPVLFSPLHGLTTWSPIVYLALIGLLPLIGRQPALGLLLALAFGAQVWVNGAMEVWWGGSSFGARRFASCGVIFAAGLAALLDWARRRPVAAAAVACAPFVLVNVILVGHVRRSGLSLAGGATAPDLLRPVYDLLGNPFSFPANARFALEHGVPWSRYDALGLRVYQRLRLDVGTSGDATFLTYGWSAPERDGAYTYRWATGPAAGVVAPLSRRADYVVRFRAEPFVPPGADGPARIGVLLNGRRADTITLEAGLREYRVDVPQALLVRNLNHLRFEFSRATAPSAVGPSPDDRPLAVSFDWIELARRQD